MDADNPFSHNGKINIFSDPTDGGTGNNNLGTNFNSLEDAANCIIGQVWPGAAAAVCSSDEEGGLSSNVL
jgi:hypothetical protein